MKIYWTKGAWVVLAGAGLLTACKKNDSGQLDGPVPVPSFTVTTRQVGLTTEATFTNTSTYSGPGTALYVYDFGDGASASAGAPGTSVTHAYSAGGTLQTQLESSARGGNAFSARRPIVLPDVTTLAKALLTGGSSKTWRLDNLATDPIVVGPNDDDIRGYYPQGATVPAGSLPTCQSDDEYTFSTTNAFSYQALAETFVAGVYACQAPRTRDDTFTFGAVPTGGTGVAQFTFAKAGTFIGVTDAPDLTYRIMSISADGKTMVLRAGKYVPKGSTGTVFEMKFRAK